MNASKLVIALALLTAAPLALAGDGGPKPGAATAVGSTPPATSRLTENPLCLQDTGSRIKRKSADCTSVTGRTYSRDQLLNTGRSQNIGDALQMLDPSITTGGH
ncbi:MAG: hypothetical protein KGJ55_04400 [Gammaproteobacteria bacterium]|nr:hypothetical protein [Gammaproteobacteria bacterium]